MSKKKLIEMLEVCEDNPKSIKWAIQAYYSYLSKQSQVVFYHPYDQKIWRDIQDMLQRDWDTMSENMKETLLKNKDNIANKQVRLFLDKILSK